MRVKRKIKQVIAKALEPYGFSVDGIKPAGYLSKTDLSYSARGFTNLREYFDNKWQSNLRKRCDDYVNYFFKSRLQGNEIVLEIGTGVGFLTHSLLQTFPKLNYISFELDKLLEQYLDKEFSAYQFKSHRCQGNSLTSVGDTSIDVVVVFGVFTYLNYSNIMQYFQEITRVCKPNGLLFFDIFDTDRLNTPLVDAFMRHSQCGDNRPYISGRLLNEVLARKGFSLVNSFQEDPELGYYSHKLLFVKN